MRGDSISIPLNLKSFSLYKHNSFFVKFVVLFLLLALAFHLSSYNPFDFTSTIDAQETDLLTSDNGTLSIPSTEVVPKTEGPKPKCNLFKGEWVPNPAGPVYNNNTCKFIEDHQNCMKNGRPDSGYLYWRWSPRDCKLPKFNPERFLGLMRNKKWAFIGDSISRNHVQSLICTLSQVDQAEEIYHDEQFKSKTWRFPSYNFTVAVIWSPFLLRADIYEDNNGFSTSETELHLDKLDPKWTAQLGDFDYATIAGGKWFLKTAIYYENNTIQGCHYCPKRNLTELGFDHAYRKAVRLVLGFLASSSHKATVFFRTVTPDHFEGGEWFSGGTCERRVPFKEGQWNISFVDNVMHEIELDEFVKAVNGSGPGPVLKLLDTTELSLSRPDGHPGPYRQYQPFAKDKKARVQNDCLHWCLPGPIDSWNDLVMEMLIDDQ